MGNPRLPAAEKPYPPGDELYEVQMLEKVLEAILDQDTNYLTI
jgi:hypothetical protein